MNQPLTVNQTATTTATTTAQNLEVEVKAEGGKVINLFQRDGSAKWSFRYRPKEAARGLFNGRADIHRSTRTGDKEVATRVAMRMILELDADCELYINEFAPWATEQLRDPVTTLTCKYCKTPEDLMLRMLTGEAFKVFKAELQGHSQRLATVYLPALPVVSVSLPTAITPIPEPQAQIKAEPLGVSVVVIPKLLELYLDRHTLGAGSVKDMRKGLEFLMDWLKENKHSHLDADIAFEFIEHLQQCTKTYSTARKRYSHTHLPFQFAMQAGKSIGVTLPFNPFSGLVVIPDGSPTESPREQFSPSDCKTMLDNLPSVEVDPTFHWVIKIGAVTGMRSTAVSNLLASDIKNEHGVVCVKVSATEGNKTKLPYWIPIHTIFADEFYSWFEANRPAEDSQRIFTGTGDQLRAQMGMFLKNLNIVPTPPKTMKSYHSFRHSTATWLKEVMPVEAHRNAMQGRQEQGSVKTYGTLAGVLTYAGVIITAPLWWEDDYHKRLFEKGLKVWGE